MLEWCVALISRSSSMDLNGHYLHPHILDVSHDPKDGER